MRIVVTLTVPGHMSPDAKEAYLEHLEDLDLVREVRDALQDILNRRFETSGLRITVTS